MFLLLGLVARGALCYGIVLDMGKEPPKGNGLTVTVAEKREGEASKRLLYRLSINKTGKAFIPLGGIHYENISKAEVTIDCISYEITYTPLSRKGKTKGENDNWFYFFTIEEIINGELPSGPQRIVYGEKDGEYMEFSVGFVGDVGEDNVIGEGGVAFWPFGSYAVVDSARWQVAGAAFIDEDRVMAKEATRLWKDDENTTGLSLEEAEALLEEGDIKPLGREVAVFPAEDNTNSTLRLAKVIHLTIDDNALEKRRKVDSNYTLAKVSLRATLKEVDGGYWVNVSVSDGLSVKKATDRHGKELKVEEAGDGKIKVEACTEMVVFLEGEGYLTCEMRQEEEGEKGASLKKIAVFAAVVVVVLIVVVAIICCVCKRKKKKDTSTSA